MSPVPKALDANFWSTSDGELQHSEVLGESSVFCLDRGAPTRALMLGAEQPQLGQCETVIINDRNNVGFC